MLKLVTFFLVILIIILAILLVTYIINKPTADYEKHSSYECGFEPFGDSRTFFDIHYYVIGLLFIIFDLEIIFLMPFVIDIKNLSIIGYLTFIFLMIIIIIGFYFEWSIGLLNWIPKRLEFDKKIYLMPQSLIFIEIDILFITIWLLIVISLIFNSIRIDIYRVLNLIFLSIVVVLMWLYKTDFIFIYVSFILAFIGAVLMLFLSVVIMLPSNIRIMNIKKQTIATNLFGMIITNYQITNYIYYLIILIIIIYSIYLMPRISINKLWYKVNLIWNYIYVISEIIMDWIKLLLKKPENETWYHFLGFARDINDLQFLIRKNIYLGNIRKNEYFAMYIYDIMHYINENIISKLYLERNSKIHINKNVAVVWDSFFDKVELPIREWTFDKEDYMNPARNIGRIFTSKLFIPYKFRYSLWNIMPKNYKIESERFIEGVDWKAVYYNRLLSIKYIFKFFIYNIAIEWKKREGFMEPRAIFVMCNIKKEILDDVKQKWPKVLIWHDIIYYIKENIDIHLLKNKNENIWFNIFYKPLNCIEDFLFTPWEWNSIYIRNTKYRFGPKNFVPYKPRFSLRNILPNKFHIIKIKYLDKKYIKINLLILIICSIITIIINIFILIIWKIKNYIYINNGIKNISSLIASFPFLIQIPVDNAYITNDIIYRESILAIKYILYEENQLFIIIPIITLLSALIGAEICSRYKNK